MDWLIAHRGAQSDGRENTLPAFRAYNKYPLDWVELDIHTTADNVVVCHHDFDVGSMDINTHTFKDLSRQDSELTTFSDAIKTIKNTPLWVEVKPLGTVNNIQAILKAHPDWRVSSYYAAILEEAAAGGLNKNRLFLLQHRHPFWQLQKVLNNGYGGIGLKQAYATPLLLWRCHRRGIKVFIYTVNSLWLARYFRYFFPYAGLCTNRPDKLARLK